MKKIAFLVFNETYHYVRSHLTNKIMQNFYHAKRRKKKREFLNILKLTVSLVVRKKKNEL